VPPPSTLKKEAAGSFETLLTFYQFAWCHIPEDHSLTLYLLKHSSVHCYMWMGMPKWTVVSKNKIYIHIHVGATHTHFFVLRIICSGHYMHIKCSVQLYYCVTNTGWFFRELSQLKIQQLLDSFFRLNCLLLYQWWTFSLKLWCHSWERSPEFEAKKNEILVLKFLPGREWFFFHTALKTFL
jgi:hypothetical protein